VSGVSSTAVSLNNEYNITGKATTAATAVASTATATNNKYDITGKVSTAAHDAAAWAEEHHVREKVGNAASVAATATATAASDVAAWAEEYKVRTWSLFRCEVENGKRPK
jgi:hypothetical protein